jgi:tetratricopeptide (TPR) repeat protein
LREVGQQLGVANLLEGSVQKAGNAVHINVQLIKAASDAHLWAESYDRELQNIFGVEAEVAGAIAQALKARLAGSEEKALALKPTDNVVAYEAYLRGRSIEETRHEYAGFQQAAANYATAVQLDPKFAAAWAHLAVIRGFLYFNGVDLANNSAAAIKEAADQAFALQPELGEAWIAQGIYRYRILHDFPGALQAYQEAQKRLPNNSDVFEQMAYVERRLGYWDAAETHYLAAIALDPRNLNILISMAYQFLSPLRRFAEAQAVLDRALQIAPGDESVFSTKALLFQADGQLDDAAKELGKVKANSDDEVVVVARSLQFGYERRFDTAIAYLQPYTTASRPRETVSDTAKILLVWLGYCQEWAGRNGEARATFMRAVQAIKPSPDSVVPIGAQQLSCELALAYAGLGEKEKALDQARRAVVDYQDDAYAKPFAQQVLAEIEARFGDIDAAIGIIPKLLEVPSGITPGSLRVDPSWDPLRKDPRFQKLANAQP